MTPDTDLQPGMLVVDRDQDLTDQNEAIVMTYPPVPADQWDVTALDCTLAEANPDYPADSQTVIVIFRSRFDGDDEKYRVDVSDEIRRKLRDREEIAIGDVADLCKFYAFPAPRLEPTGEYWPPGEGDHTDAEGADVASEETEDEDGDVGAEPEGEGPGIDLTPLATVMREAGFDNVEKQSDHVTAMKLGETYRVDHTGNVVAGGALADKLQSFVQKRYVDGAVDDGIEAAADAEESSL